ncbi:MAG TPA: M48 family metalloprotease [Candidatus Eisenbacteria bacterium]|nr:M48 family metalloprotease [Candidatus Eisenbacteria bacterium]
MRRSIRRWWWVLGIALLAGCAKNPVTGKSELSLVSGAQEAQMGKEGYNAVIQEYGIYEDPKLQAYVDSIGQSLARVSHTPQGPWKFTLLDDPTVNAFAMPGGYVYMTRGMMSHLNSEAQLAGVMGHEIGHVTARHSAQRITQQQLAGIGLGVAGIFSTGFRRYSEVATQALGLMFLKYGRDDENQSDELGVQYSTAAGWDPRDIPATYAMLKRVSDQAGQRLPSFLSTHPDPGSREERTRALAEKAAAGKTGLIVRERAYLQRLDGMIYGRDPQQGYFEGTHYYHPKLAFQITFPEGWKTQDSRSFVMGASQDQKAVMQLTLAPKSDLSPAAYIDALRKDNRIADSQGANETIGGYQAWVGRVAVQNQQGQQATLVAVLIRTSPELMYQILGQPGSEAGEQQILRAARSFGRLTDPARLSVKPDRLRVVPVTRSGDFMSVVQAQGPQAIGIEQTAIMNNKFNDQQVNAGELIKIVARGR